MSISETVEQTMDCVRCGVKLEANARFCRNCGLTVAASQLQNTSVTEQEESGTDSTVRIGPVVEQLSTLAAHPQQVPETPLDSQQSPIKPQNGTVQQLPFQNGNGQHMVPSSYATLPQFRSSEQVPPEFYQSREAARRAQLAAMSKPRRRNALGCVLGVLGTLIVVALLLAGAWVYVLHPYLHDLAVTQMDSAMNSAVDQISPAGLIIPPGTTVPISESTVNTLLANNPTNPGVFHNTSIQITAKQVLLDFQVYGQESTITTVPQVQNGKLMATNVTVSGIARFVLSPDDITKLLNAHFEDAQNRINHRVTNVRLLDQEIDVTVS